MKKVLGEKFFKRNTVEVARELLGKFLVRRIGNNIVVPRGYSRRLRGRDREVALMITEVEIYDGFRDRASHASRGKTTRNSIMFGPAGYWYIYFTYGMHWMLNIVTRERDYPAAILIRSVRSVDEKINLDGPARQNFSPDKISKRNLTGRSKNLGGPAKLTKFLKIDKKLNGLLANKKSGLWIEDRGVMNKELQIMNGPRVGVNYAGPYWARRKWRFWI